MTKDNIIEFQAQQIINQATQIESLMESNAYLTSVAARLNDFLYSLQQGHTRDLFELAEAMDWVAPKPMDGDITHNWVSAVKWVADRIWPF